MTQKRMGTNTRGTVTKFYRVPLEFEMSRIIQYVSDINTTALFVEDIVG